MTDFVVHRNGEAATADQLASLAFAGYAHFTATQVRDSQIRGLDLHLARLRFASGELFGQALPDEQVKSYLRAALAPGPADLSLTATVYSRAGEFTASAADLEVLVRTSPAATPPAGPLALATVEYERVLPAIKHVGEVAKTYYLRQAVAHGFDDAAFVDRQGRLSEATIWNLAFWDGTAVVWPKAEVLDGITQQIVRRRLDTLGIPQRTQEITRANVSTLAGAAVLNSWSPGIAVRKIGSTPLPEAHPFMELLHEAYESDPVTAP
jgi:branched-subunit amino acid aminotransferase/4-amino-4-deoxychorismate lyase